ELDLAGGRGADAELGFGLAAAEAVARGVDQERGDAARALVRIGHGEQHDVLRHRARGDPALLAVDHVAAVVAPGRAAAHAGRVATGLRIGQREGTCLGAPGHRALVFLRYL